MHLLLPLMSLYVLYNLSYILNKFGKFGKIPGGDYTI